MSLQSKQQYLIMMWPGLWVLLPVAGWIGDSFLGRYRAVKVGVFLAMLSFLILLCAAVILQFNRNSIPAIALLCIYIIVTTCSMPYWKSLYTNMLPFIIDQMIGASADDISAVVQWYYWSISLGVSTPNLLGYIPNQLKQNRLVICLALIFLCLSSVLITDCLCHKWLDIHYKSSSPFKTIFKVLNYARKTKYPEHRSAFTYIDEEEPSRLDYGKHKFGGPYTEEEVEDVKTIFRLLPLSLSIFGAFIDSKFYIHSDNTDYSMLLTTFQPIDLQHMIVIVIPFLLIPAYRFIVFPLLHNRIPTFLTRVGAGLVLIIIGNLLNLTVDTIGHLHSNNTQCMLSDTSHGSAIPLYWLLISETINAVGRTLVMCTSMEFIMAQSPNRMRGVMMGLGTLGTVMLGFGYVTHYGLKLVVKHFSNVTPSCEFYYYLVLSILLILSLVLFTIAAKRYKLRERDRHVNIQAIAEEHYERYFDQEEEYMREAANMYKNY